MLPEKKPSGFYTQLAVTQLFVIFFSRAQRVQQQFQFHCFCSYNFSFIASFKIPSWHLLPAALETQCRTCSLRLSLGINTWEETGLGRCGIHGGMQAQHQLWPTLLSARIGSSEFLRIGQSCSGYISTGYQLWAAQGRVWHDLGCHSLQVWQSLRTVPQVFYTVPLYPL